MEASGVPIYSTPSSVMRRLLIFGRFSRDGVTNNGEVETRAQMQKWVWHKSYLA